MNSVKTKRLILIDAHALIHRAYHAIPKLTTSKGEVVNAIYGFTLLLLKVIKEFKPDYIVAAFDLPGPTFRHEEYKEYKATRIKAPDELYEQIPKVKEILKAFGIPIYAKEKYEADDIIGTISKMTSQSDIENIIVSGDLDTLQLVSKNTKALCLKRGVTETILYDENEVLKRYGLKPNQLVDFKALKGDPSDNILGVPGIGEKTAIELIAQYGSLENLYKELEKWDCPLKSRIKNLLIKNKDEAFFSKQLATISTNVPIDFNLEDARWGKADRGKIKKLFQSLEFYSLLKRLKEV